MHPKLFLVEECENVRNALNEALQHDYGPTQSKEFYEECELRLDSLLSHIKNADEKNLNLLGYLADEVSNLSSLITLIERSHLGQFSWPFAQALRILGTKICRENSELEIEPEFSTSGSLFKDPIFFISSDGGLWAYRIHAEEGEEGDIPLIAQRRIFNIVFPRSLKHHVLLHTILGHEIGHAAWSIPTIQSAFKSNVVEKLMCKGPLSEAGKAAKWIKDHYPNLRPSKDIMIEVLESWTQEFFCDLFGLLLFGPSFLPAHRTLLCTLDPPSLDPGAEHPPNVCRFDMLAKAVTRLGWCTNSTGTTPMDLFWQNVLSQPVPIPEWAKVFTQEQVDDAVDALLRILDSLGKPQYVPVDDCELDELLALLKAWVPPVGSRVNSAGKVRLRSVDFRTILYVGWIAWYAKDQIWEPGKELGFLNINRLCDRGILQQYAVDLANGFTERV